MHALEVVTVGGFGGPGGLGGLLAGPLAGGLGAEALARPVVGRGDERFVATEALERGPGASHRTQEDATRREEANRGGAGRRRKKTEKKEEGLAPQAEEDAAKKTPPLPDFKPAESAEFQLGADSDLFGQRGLADLAGP